jgi:hypothetical protein
MFTEETYLLAKAVDSAVFMSMMNALSCQGDAYKAEGHFRKADFLDAKFKSEFGYHYSTYMELYEKSKRIHAD